MISEHKKRVITAVVGALFVFASYYLYRGLAVKVLIGAISFVGYRELVSILLQKPQRPAEDFLRAKLLASSLVSVPYILLVQTGAFSGPLTVFFPFLTFLFLAIYYSHGSDAESLGVHLRDAIVQCFGLLYIAGFLSFVPAIHALPHGPAWLLFLLGIVWIGDIGGYYGGKNFGKHKLSPSISPGKTLEGSASGLAAVTVWSVLVHFWLLPHESLLKLAATAVFTGACAQLGDLAESLIKRVGGVKDSGTLFPGHGGVFDRFDSLILASPLFYFLAQFLP